MTDSIETQEQNNSFFKLEQELFLLGLKKNNLKQLEASFKVALTNYFNLDNFFISLDSQNKKNTSSHHYINLSLQDSQYKMRLNFIKIKTFHTTEVLDLKKIKKTLNTIILKVFIKSQKKELFDQWKLIFDSISTPLCLTDKFAKIYTANTNYLKFSKNNYSSLISTDAFSSFFKPNFNQYKIINKSAKNNFNIFEVQAKNNINEKIHYYEVLNQNFKIKTHTQEDISLYFFRDISQQKKIEKELLTKSQKVELGLISSSIAHELNNPVGSMLLYIDLVAHQLGDHSPLQSELKEIKTAILKCAEIIKSLLSFAKK